MLNLSSLNKLVGKRRSGKRVGRGYGSGKGGHTSGRGQKGQKARGKIKDTFEGGQQPLYKRLPHRKGFKSIHSKDRVSAVNLSIFRSIKEGTTVTPESLFELNLIPKRVKSLKVLSLGEIKHSLIFKGFTFSSEAAEKVSKSGGKII